MSKKKKIVIVGGGINGLIAANYLSKDRFSVSIIEKKSNTGIGSAFAFVEPNGTGGISSSHANAANGVLQNIVGFQTDFYHGLKIFV